MCRLDGLDLPAPDLIKLDVEGHEAAVLAGGTETIRRGRPFIVLESWWRPDDVAAMTAPLAALEAAGSILHLLTLRDGRLQVTPTSAAARTAIPGALNLLAVPPSRLAQLDAAFAG